MNEAGDVVVLRGGRWGMTSFVLVIVLAVFLVGDAAFRADWMVVLRLLGPSCFVTWGAWVLLQRPRILVSSAGVRVVNPMRVTTIPWSEVADIRMRYQIVIETNDGRTVQCWGGPNLPRPKPLRRGERPTVLRPDELAVLQDRWAVSRGELRSSSEPVQRALDGPAVVLGIAALVLVGVSILV